MPKVFLVGALGMLPMAVGAQEAMQGADAAATATQAPVAQSPVVAAPTTPADPRTSEELDFDSIYGKGPAAYDPVADATLPTPARAPASYDPWEKLNRKTHAFNNVVDKYIALPLAKFYIAVTPRVARLGVSNFFNNLGQPITVVNATLQGHPTQAWNSLGRFLINSTVGLGGFFDPASRANIPDKSEDFGQTLGVWGWRDSRFIELPLFGPRTVRDVVGLVGDGQLSPIRQIENDKVRVFTQGLALVDVRTQLMAFDSLREGASDEYSLVRDAWLQRRNYQISSDVERARSDSELPDYLQDDANPGVPADAMPMIPGAASVR